MQPAGNKGRRGQKTWSFAAHSSSVNCISIGRKSAERFITGGDDKKLHLWSTRQRAPLLSLRGNTSAIQSVLLDASEELAVAGGAAGAVKLWDLVEGRAIRTMTGHKAAPIALDLYSAGGLCASLSPADGTARVWDPRQKEAAHVFRGMGAGDAGEGGGAVGGGGAEGRGAGAGGGAESAGGKGGKTVGCVRFSPDGRWVVAGGQDGRIKVSSARGRKRGVGVSLSQPLAIPHHVLPTLYFLITHSPHAPLLPSARMSLRAQLFDLAQGRLFAQRHASTLFDLAQGRLIAQLAGHAGAVPALDFHPQELLLASAARDRTVRWWDLESFDCVDCAPPGAGGTSALAFSPQGDALFAPCTDHLKVWGWEPIRCFDSVHVGWPKVADVSVNDTSLVAVSASVTVVTLWTVDLERVLPFSKDPDQCFDDPIPLPSLISSPPPSPFPPRPPSLPSFPRHPPPTQRVLPFSKDPDQCFDEPLPLPSPTSSSPPSLRPHFPLSPLSIPLSPPLPSDDVEGPGCQHHKPAALPSSRARSSSLPRSLARHLAPTIASLQRTRRDPSPSPSPSACSVVLGRDDYNGGGDKGGKYGGYTTGGDTSTDDECTSHRLPRGGSASHGATATTTAATPGHSATAANGYTASRRSSHVHSQASPRRSPPSSSPSNPSGHSPARTAPSSSAHPGAHPQDSPPPPCSSASASLSVGSWGFRTSSKARGKRQESPVPALSEGRSGSAPSQSSLVRKLGLFVPRLRPPYAVDDEEVEEGEEVEQGVGGGMAGMVRSQSEKVPGSGPLVAIRHGQLADVEVSANQKVAGSGGVGRRLSGEEERRRVQEKGKEGAVGAAERGNGAEWRAGKGIGTGISAEAGLAARRQAVRQVGEMWRDGLVADALAFLAVTADEGVLVDVVSAMSAQGSSSMAGGGGVGGASSMGGVSGTSAAVQCLGVDGCAALVPILGGLLASAHSSHVHAALLLLCALLRCYSDGISAARSAVHSPGVDLHMEMWLQRCAECAEAFQALAPRLQMLLHTGPKENCSLATQVHMLTSRLAS
ncbi:unnamed protein product [Closterium sp. Yama58-4]|nr:unnamed protein product [Closterium sp. Yama58-4]